MIKTESYPEENQLISDNKCSFKLHYLFKFIEKYNNLNIKQK